MDELHLNGGGFQSARRSNQALDYRTMAISNALRFKYYDENNGPNRNAQFFIDDLPQKEKLRVSRDVGEKLQSRFTESNARLVKDWPHINNYDMAVDWKSFPEGGNLYKLHALDEFSEHLRYIVERLNAQLWLERSIAKNLESRIAELSDDMTSAIELCNTARQQAIWASAIESVRAEACMLQDQLTARIDYLQKKSQTS